MNISDIFRIYRDIRTHNGISKEDAIILLNLVIICLEAIRPHVQKPAISIAIAGVQKILEETKTEITHED